MKGPGPCHTEGCSMVRAVIQNGMIQPIEPLPQDWRDGQEVVVGRVESQVGAQLSDASADVDAIWDEVDRLAKDIDPGDERLFLEAIKDIRKQAKELARRGKK